METGKSPLTPRRPHLLVPCKTFFRLTIGFVVRISERLHFSSPSHLSPISWPGIRWQIKSRIDMSFFASQAFVDACPLCRCNISTQPSTLGATRSVIRACLLFLLMGFQFHRAQTDGRLQCPDRDDRPGPVRCLLESSTEASPYLADLNCYDATQHEKGYGKGSEQSAHSQSARALYCQVSYRLLLLTRDSHAEALLLLCID